MTRQRERGQVLVIFAGGLIAFLAVAALVFDVGQNLLDWRAQRNAADAAALAGARYIVDPACKAAPSNLTCPDAYNAAIEVARLNGYGDLNGDGVPDRGTVTIFIPPQPGRNFAGQPGFIEVDIHTDRPSFFAAILGVLQQNVDALAVAGNSDDIALDYSIMATDPACDGANPMWVHGGARATVQGNVQVNSNCNGGLTIAGSSGLSAPECNVVGTQVINGKPQPVCTALNEGAGFMQPPLFVPPTDPGLPAAAEVLAGKIYDVYADGFGFPNDADDILTPIPPGCPGSATPATNVDPIGCTFPGPTVYQLDPVTGDPVLDPITGLPVPAPVSRTGYDIFLLHPGAYPGGLSFNGAVRVYLSPGVYYIAGGGITLNGKGVQLVSVDRTNVAADPYRTKGRGVLIYNTEDPLYSTECANPLLPEPAGACIGDFHTNGASDNWTTCTYEPPPPTLDTTKRCTWMYLAADDDNGLYPGLVYYQNPNLYARMIVNGDGPKMEILGTIYVPYGEVQINGNSDDGISAQIIAWHIDFSGNSAFSVTYNPDYFVKVSAAGLVQ